MAKDAIEMMQIIPVTYWQVVRERRGLSATEKVILKIRKVSRVFIKRKVLYIS